LLRNITQQPRHTEPYLTSVRNELKIQQQNRLDADTFFIETSKVNENCRVCSLVWTVWGLGIGTEMEINCISWVWWTLAMANP